MNMPPAAQELTVFFLENSAKKDNAYGNPHAALAARENTVAQ